jgi:hypothetical protein
VGTFEVQAQEVFTSVGTLIESLGNEGIVDKAPTAARLNQVITTPGRVLGGRGG